jgi:hypothetical protein
MEKIIPIELGGVHLLDLSPTYEWRVCSEKGYVSLSQRYAVANLLDRGDDSNGAEHAIFLCRSRRSPYLVHSLECKLSDLRWKRAARDGGSRALGDDAVIFLPGARLRVPILPSYLHDIDAAETLYEEVCSRRAGSVVGVPGGDPLIDALARRSQKAVDSGDEYLDVFDGLDDVQWSGLKGR